MDTKVNRILLVEDNKIDQKAFLRAMDGYGAYSCTVAGSVAEARSVLAGEQFDVVISDYMLGDGTAFDVLKLAQNTPVVIVTGTGDEEIAVKAWHEGACDYLIKDVNGHYLKTVPVTIENTIKHSRAEKKLQLLSHAITKTDDSVYITNQNNVIIFVNRAFCDTYGYEEDEVLGKDCSILWLSTVSGDELRGVSGWETGYYHRRKNGEEFPVSLYKSAVRDASGAEIAQLGVARDISENVYAEEKLRHINLELKQGNRRMDLLA